MLFISTIYANTQGSYRRLNQSNQPNSQIQAQIESQESFQSGGFLGLNVGYIMSALDYNVSGLTTNGPNIPTYPISAADSLNGGGFDIGIIAGYKWHWKWSFAGIRLYGNLDYSQSTLKGASAYKPSLINVGINADFLATFVTAPTWDFGMILGMGLGADLYQLDDKLISDLMNNLTNKIHGTHANNVKNLLADADGNIKKNFFNAWLNVGLRVGIAQHHSLELLVKVPFIKHEPLNYTKINMLTGNQGGVVVLRASASMPAIIKVGYVYSF